MRAVDRFVLLATIIVSLVSAGATASATTWSVGLSAGSNGQAQTRGLPATPSATATCSGILGNIVVSWTSVSPSNVTYTVYQSTTSATTGFSVIASGLSASPYTVSGLGLGSYWYKVQAVAGANWAGAQSAATAQRNITLVVCT